MSAYSFLMLVDAATPSLADRSPQFPEIASARGYVPLAWLAMFEPDDLHVLARRGGRATLTGFTTIARARENLARRAPMLGDMFTSHRIGDRHLPILDRHLQQYDPERHVQLWTDELYAPFKASEKAAIAALIRGFDTNDDAAWTALYRAVDIRRDASGIPLYRDVAVAVNACVGWIRGEPAPGSDPVFAPIFARFSEHFEHAIGQVWADAIPSTLCDYWWTQGQYDRVYAVVERLEWTCSSQRLAWHAALDPDPARARERAAMARARAPRVPLADTEPYRPWPEDVVAALQTGDLAPLHAALADPTQQRSMTSIAFALPTIPPEWHAEIVADNARADEDYDEGLQTAEERWIRMWTAERCGGPAVIATEVAAILANARAKAQEFAARFYLPGYTSPPKPTRVHAMVDEALAPHVIQPHLQPLLRILLRLGERGELELVREAVARLEARLGPLTEQHNQRHLPEVLSFCPGRARTLINRGLGVVDLAGHDYRTALLADALTRDGEHTMATTAANELLEVEPGRLAYPAVGRLARTAMHGRDDGPTELAELAAATLARLPGLDP